MMTLTWMVVLIIINVPCILLAYLVSHTTALNIPSVMHLDIKPEQVTCSRDFQHDLVAYHVKDFLSTLNHFNNLTTFNFFEQNVEFFLTECSTEMSVIDSNSLSCDSSTSTKCNHTNEHLTCFLLYTDLHILQFQITAYMNGTLTYESNLLKFNIFTRCNCTTNEIFPEDITTKYIAESRRIQLHFDATQLMRQHPDFFQFFFNGKEIIPLITRGDVIVELSNASECVTYTFNLTFQSKTICRSMVPSFLVKSIIPNETECYDYDTIQVGNNTLKLVLLIVFPTITVLTITLVVVIIILRKRRKRMKRPMLYNEGISRKLEKPDLVTIQPLECHQYEELEELRQHLYDQVATHA